MLLLALFLVLLNGFFVAAEFSLVKVRSTRIDELARTGSATARMTQRQLDHLDAYLSATQLGITIASIGLGWVGEPAVASLLEPLFHKLHLSSSLVHPISFGVAFATVSALHIIIGELAPKSWAIQRPEHVANACSYPLHIFYWIFRPAIVALNGMAGALLRLIGIQPAAEHELAHTQEELRMLLTQSGEHGILKKSEVDLVHHVFRFADKVARDVMVPRVDMVYLDASWPVEKAIEFASRHTFTRYPLCEGTPDRVIGIVHLRRLLPLTGAHEGDLRSLAQATDLLVVPEAKPIDQLLRDFQRQSIHMAIVADEHGGTAGLVTMEDVIEQIVGEIHDEFEPRYDYVEKQADGALLADGRVLLADLRFEHDIDLAAGEAETIAGWVMEQMGDIPRAGERLLVEGVEVTIKQMAGRRVKQVELRKIARPEETETPAAAG